MFSTSSQSNWNMASWFKGKCFSCCLLLSRFTDLLLRCRELDTWTQDLTLPAVVWLSGLFNPQSFLTGQCREGGQPLNAYRTTSPAEASLYLTGTALPRPAPPRPHILVQQLLQRGRGGE